MEALYQRFDALIGVKDVLGRPGGNLRWRLSKGLTTIAGRGR